MREREKRAYVKLSQWEFPDTATFDAEILVCDESVIGPNMEKYCDVVLTLLMPYWSVKDFVPTSGKLRFLSTYHFPVKFMLQMSNKV